MCFDNDSEPPIPRIVVLALAGFGFCLCSCLCTGLSSGESCGSCASRAGSSGRQWQRCRPFFSGAGDQLAEGGGSGKRRSRQEAAAIRQSLADGQTLVFPTRHQWRHYTKRKPI